MIDCVTVDVTLQNNIDVTLNDNEETNYLVEVSRSVTRSTYIDNDNDDFLKINEYNIMFEENLIDNNENIVLGKNIINESGLTRKRYIVDDNIGKDDYEQNDSNIFSSDINRVNDTDLTNNSNFMVEKIFEK